jgi:hypothetical protein
LYFKEIKNFPSPYRTFGYGSTNVSSRGKEQLGKLKRKNKGNKSPYRGLSDWA